ncbi:MAG: hypothetical protein AAGE80_15995 [Pseudomonadota bacterium]
MTRPFWDFGFRIDPTRPISAMGGIGMIAVLVLGFFGWRVTANLGLPGWIGGGLFAGIGALFGIGYAHRQAQRRAEHERELERERRAIRKAERERQLKDFRETKRGGETSPD